ncbi:MAG: hypothetical protein ABDH21_01015 [bacterium]
MVSLLLSIIRNFLLYTITISFFSLFNFTYSQSIKYQIHETDINGDRESDLIFFIDSFKPQECSASFHEEISLMYRYKDYLYLINKKGKSIARYRNNRLDVDFGKKFKRVIENIRSRTKINISDNQLEILIINDYLYFLITIHDFDKLVKEVILCKLTMDLEFVKDFYEQGVLRLNFKKQKYYKVGKEDVVVDKNDDVYLFFITRKKLSDEQKLLKILKISSDVKKNEVTTEEIDTTIEYPYECIFSANSFDLDNDSIIYFIDYKKEKILGVDLVNKITKKVADIKRPRCLLSRFYIDYQIKSIFLTYVDYNQTYLYVEKICKESGSIQQIVVHEIKKYNNLKNKESIDIDVQEITYLNGLIYLLYNVYYDGELYSNVLLFDIRNKIKRDIPLSKLLYYNSKEMQEDIYIPKRLLVDKHDIWVSGVYLKKKNFRHNFVSKINLNGGLQFRLITKDTFEYIFNTYRDFEVRKIMKLNDGYLVGISKNGIEHLIRLKSDFTVDFNFAQRGIFTLPTMQIAQSVIQRPIYYYNIKYDNVEFQNNLLWIDQDQGGNIYILGFISSDEYRKEFYYLLKIDQKGNIDKNFNKTGFMILGNLVNQYKRKEVSENEYKIFLNGQQLYIINILRFYSYKGTFKKLKSKKLNNVMLICCNTGKIIRITGIDNTSIPFRYDFVSDTQMVSDGMFITLEDRSRYRTFLVKIDSSGKLDKTFGKDGCIVLEGMYQSKLIYNQDNNTFLVTFHNPKKNHIIHAFKMDEKGNIDNTIGIVTVDKLVSIFTRIMNTIFTFLFKIQSINLVYVTDGVHISDRKFLLFVLALEYKENKHWIVEIDYSEGKRRIKYRDLSKLKVKIEQIVESTYSIQVKDIDINRVIMFKDAHEKQKIVFNLSFSGKKNDSSGIYSEAILQFSLN